jgi:DNA-binding IclR family transcriptional regulator
VGHGDAATAFELARRLLEANRGVLGKITHLCAESEDGAVAVVAYGEGNLLAATAAPGKSLRLLASLAQAVRGAH